VAKAYIGTSGWNYKHWADGVFYPAQLRPSEWLEFYAEHFDTVEINNSFYRLPSEETFKSWRGRVPSGFIFAVKASRFLTHLKRLKDPEDPLDLFFSRSRNLRETRGPILFQLPPQLRADIPRLENFLDALKRHTSRGVRATLEVRHESWLDTKVFMLLRDYQVALCFADWRDVPVTSPITSDFVYVRRHAGPDAGNYPRAALDRDSANVREWLRQGLDVYVYFNNDPHGHAVRNAKYLKSRCVEEGRSTPSPFLLPTESIEHTDRESPKGIRSGKKR
jgi:uncharacterized protein YecE (DUF72 family)